MSSHPYVTYERTPVWEVVDAALTELEANHDLVLTTGRAYVIGYMCSQLADLVPTISPSALAVWRHLREVVWLESAALADQIELAYALVNIAESGTDHHVALFLRDSASRLAGTDPQPTGEFVPLARKIIEVCEGERESGDAGADV